jgi:ribose-phosphate pyrophosphokinase
MGIEIKNYPDGSSYAKVTPLYEFTFRINSYEDLWHLNQVIDAQNNLGVKPIVHIPNLIDAQADKRFNKGESSGLKLVCDFLNNMDAHFKIFHPHNPEVVEALLDNVEIIDNSIFIKGVLLNIEQENLILMSSDAGGFKPLIKLCDKIKWDGETSSASKSRSYDNDKSSLLQRVDREDFQGKDILIIDDICVYGGTFKGLAKILRERNCGKLYLAVSHMTVQELGQDPVTDYFDKVFTTNSKFDKYYGRDDFESKNLNVINFKN